MIFSNSLPITRQNCCENIASKIQVTVPRIYGIYMFTTDCRGAYRCEGSRIQLLDDYVTMDSHLTDCHYLNDNVMTTLFLRE
jgi:hypothetical protein